jgi:hypothetical protein
MVMRKETDGIGKADIAVVDQSSGDQMGGLIGGSEEG